MHRPIRACLILAMHAGAWVAEHCAPSVQIKAAGGVRTLDDLLRVRALGATRVGATATATATQAILDEAARRFSAA